MPKPNPKHKKNQQSKKLPTLKRRNFITYSSHNSDEQITPIPNVPKFPNSSQLQEIRIKNEHILMCIEGTIINYYNLHRDMVDGDVLNAIAQLLWEKIVWNSKLHNFAVKPPLSLILPDTYSSMLYSNILSTIQDLKLHDKKVSYPTIWNCLAVIFDSARFWAQSPGQQNYLRYVAQFIPSETLNLNNYTTYQEEFENLNFDWEEEQDFDDDVYFEEDSDFELNSN